MTLIKSIPPADEAGDSAAAPPGRAGKVWSVGKLVYTQRGLIVLFAWLLGNDLCLMLMEQVAPQLTPLLLKDHGASNRDIALYLSSLSGVLTLFINPLVSTWSDRHRGPFGRRRPFLLAATPFCAVFLAAIPCMPHLAAVLGLSARAGAVLLMGLCFLVFTLFNSVIQAIFTYFFWDVVPEALLGRFTAMTKVISTVAMFVWNYFLFGYAEGHMIAVYGGVAAFFLVVYLLSVWQVKEGGYPPVEPRKKTGFIAPVRTYLAECFGQSYYLWVYLAMTAYQVGNLAIIYQIFYLHNQLNLSLDTIGKMRAWPAVIMIALSYPLGVAIDRLKPIRLVAPTLAIWSVVNLGSYFFVRGQWSLLLWGGFFTIASFIFTVSFGVMNVEVFPRAKLGQFCSATTVCYQVAGFVVALPLGMLFDRLKDYRGVYLWSALFDALAALFFVKVYLNWKKRGPAVLQ